MLISLDLPDDLVTAIDEANEKVRLTAPAWPFGSSISVTPKTPDEWAVARQYYAELDTFRDNLARSRGKKIRSRSELIKHVMMTLLKNGQLETCYQESLPEQPKIIPSNSLLHLESIRKPFLAPKPLQRAFKDEEETEKTTS